VGVHASPCCFSGQYKDTASGLYYLRARYYDPATQQFLTRDPLLAATEQAYAYAGGSPLNATDPSGLANKWADDTFADPYQTSFEQLDWAARHGGTGDAGWGDVWRAVGNVYSTMRRIHDAVLHGGDESCGLAMGGMRGPALKGIDIDHIYSNHHPSGAGAQQSGNKDLFPESWTKNDIMSALRQAWTSRQRIQTREARTAEGDYYTTIKYRGYDPGSGRTIEMRFNAETGIMETAYPVDVPLEIPIDLLELGGE
jgi:RHS repeat-associated protein